MVARHRGRDSTVVPKVDALSSPDAADSSFVPHESSPTSPVIDSSRGPTATAIPEQHSKITISVVLDIAISVYTLLAFLMTSSLMDLLLMRQSVFQDDLVNGVYDFEPRDHVDQVILDQMHSATLGQSKYVGYEDHRTTYPSASLCIRLNVDKGTRFHATYNGDRQSRRTVKFIHTKLPANCTGSTVADNATDYTAPRIEIMNDGRQVYGKSYLHCTDPRLFVSQSASDLATNNTEFLFRPGFILAQQHFASALIGVEVQTSFCKATKIGDTDY